MWQHFLDTGQYLRPESLTWPNNLRIDEDHDTVFMRYCGISSCIWALLCSFSLIISHLKSRATFQIWFVLHFLTNHIWEVALHFFWFSPLFLLNLPSLQTLPSVQNAGGRMRMHFPTRACPSPSSAAACLWFLADLTCLHRSDWHFKLECVLCMLTFKIFTSRFLFACIVLWDYTWFM